MCDVFVMCLCVGVGVGVAWLIIPQEQLLLEGLTLAKHVSSIFVCKMCFCFTSSENCHFSSEKW